MFDVFVGTMISAFKDKSSNIEILLKISSPGGSAHKFELAYSNLMRLKSKGFKVTALVDTMCASGGYMLACCCDKIVCSEYAQIGSVGVIIKINNYAKLADKVGVEEKVFVTGTHKDLFPNGSPYTIEDEAKVRERLNDTFNAFKTIVIKHRKIEESDYDSIMNGKVFYAHMALKLNLIDEISYSKQYLDNLDKDDIYIVTPIDSSYGSSSVSSLLDLFMKIDFNKMSSIASSLSNVLTTKSNVNKILL